MTEETIFAAALEKKSPSERQAYLDEVCADKPELRSAVEELLKADSNAGSFLNRPPLGLDATVVSEVSSRDTAGSGAWAAHLSFLQPCDKPDRIGVLDQYEIIEVVGHGGMGAVLRAFDTKLSRVVAVKVMSPTLAANATAVKRFLREATTAASVHHDHVVTIHAVDDSHQPPYLVMQFIEGQTLQQKIDREGALTLTHILRIGSQAAAGLAAAHKLGLIHRDVKPANILLENGVERVKITDFGLARAADDLQVTQTGIIAGTPQYMSPEQARGEPIDARSDLFALGSVLYTMCTGRPAFRADNPVAVLRRVCDDTPRPIREVNPEIPEWLEAIVNKLLAKDPTHRFQSAAEVAELLSQHLAHVQNPAIAPRPAVVFAPPQIPRSPGLWRDGNLLVMHRNAPLPDICLKSNNPAARRLKRRVAWHHPALYLALFINPFLYFVLALVLQRSATIDIPLSDRWFLRRRQRMTFAWGTVLGGLGLTWALVTSVANGRRVAALDLAAEPLLILLMVFAGCLILFGAVYGLLACRLVRAKRITDDHLWLAGVHPEFLNRLPTFGLSLTAGRGATSSAANAAEQKALKVADRRVFLEHPVLGALAIVMLLVSVSGATYLLAAAWVRRIRESAIPASTVAPDGWTQLFNGRNLTGWTKHPEMPGKWSVEDGLLTGRGPQAGYLFSERENFTDFHLRVECRINNNGNSGIFFRADKELVSAIPDGPKQPKGYEAQILATPQPTEYPSGTLLGFPAKRDTPQNLTKPHEWFTLELIAAGNRLVTKVNGVMTVDVADDSETYKHGYLALQIWQPATVVQFRKIEIKRLKAESTLAMADSSANDIGRYHYARLQGTWSALSGEAGGQPISGNDLITLRLEFNGDHVNAQGPGPSGGGEGTFELDTAATPRRIKITRQEGRNRFAIMDGIYDLDGDRLKICMGEPEDKVTEFKSRLGTRILLAEFVRLQAAPGTIILPAHPNANATNDRPPKSIYEMEIAVAGSKAIPVEATSWGKFIHAEGDGCSLLRHGDAVSNRVIITVPGTRPFNLMAGFNFDAPRLIKEVEGDFVIEAKLPPWQRPLPGTSSRPPDGNSYLGAGLVVWIDEQNLLKWERSAWGEQDAGAPFLHAEWCAAGERIDKPDSPTGQDTATHLQIERRGGQLMLRSSSDGKLWQSQHVVTDIKLPPNVSVGIFAQNSTTAEFSSVFERLAFHAQEASSIIPESWVQLFNGRDLTGWKTLPQQPGDWKVEDGVLTGQGNLSHLFSEPSYRDFHLRVEARLLEGDSGIRFRAESGLSTVVRATGLRYPLGYEAQIVGPGGDDSRGRTGSLRRMGPLAPVPQDMAPLGEWFTFEIIAEGNHLVTRVNGQLAADCLDRDRAFSEGHLALQCGGDGIPTRVQFRKIEIKDATNE